MSRCFIFEGEIMSDEKNVEGKGFVIRDKRQFTTGGESKPETEAPVIDENTGEKTENAADRSAQKGDSMPFPEINFSSFVLSISSSVLLHFGDIADPVSGKNAICQWPNRLSIFLLS